MSAETTKTNDTDTIMEQPTDTEEIADPNTITYWANETIIKAAAKACQQS